jgi:hypothetical protein
MLNISILNGVAPFLTLFPFAQLPIEDVVKWTVVCGLLLIALVLLWQTPASQADAAPHSEAPHSEVDNPAQEAEAPNPFVLDPTLNPFAPDSPIADSPHPTNVTPQPEPLSETTAIEKDTELLHDQAIEPDTSSSTERSHSKLPPQQVTQFKASSSWSTWDDLTKQNTADRSEKPLAWGGIPLTWSTWDQLAQQNNSSSPTVEPSVGNEPPTNKEPFIASETESIEDIQENSEFHQDD